ncbi:flagellar hook-length control protein FliK [Halomonas sp. IOP_31]|uniref:flagellar hook-length control protein FliK n=1 Tax=Halomonas sp. IOP_31 TaxID=2876584 RepID=UPI001E625FA5|nr:flagellar hook-length control protein FliK [Halomonas sp. IOP_31]MCD6008732.1 flagellar hook-length control protein FliK [Halomonas sp. IOP_31]
MAMSSLPAVTSGQPASPQGGKPAQDDRSAGGFAQLFAQASQPGKPAGGVEGGSARGATNSATNRSAGSLADAAGEQNDSDDAMTLASDGAQALLSLPAQAGAVLATSKGALAGSQATVLAAATADANPGGTGNGLISGFASDELAGIQERLDTLARFRDNTPLNPLGQAIAQVQQVSQQGGLERNLLSQAGGNALKAALDATDLKNGQPVSLGTGGTVTDDKAAAGASATAGAANSASMGALSNGGATLNWTQQLQTQVAASPGGAGAQGQGGGGAWLSSISESLSAARTGNAETSAMPLHAGAGSGATPSTATLSASVVQTPTLSAPLASAEWQQSLGQQLVNLQQRGGQRVQLHLNPAELGPLSISLKVDDQLAQAQFMSANPQVRAAVEQAIPQLREALGEAGIQLGEAMVGDQQPGQQQGQDGTDAHRVAGSMGSGTHSVTNDALDDAALGLAGGLAISGVDLYA